MAEAQVGGRVLDENLPPQIALRLFDMSADGRQRLLGHRQGQQIGKIDPGGNAPRKVLGDQRWLDSLGYLADAREMPTV